ncbi:Maf family protein [Psychrobacter sp. P11G5]|uniref:Maf family protein n=1 Tax=Psychrobacter sp. P11G5 TaxID=1699624 RepID=UPI00078DB6EB|nr:Maf family protein [Psychrobacter sp. P11G5]AMN66788.1 septum formation inhibitor Maf [Psychrobacter sp. P11G5]
MDILLASGSPRRQELLSSAQLDLTIMSVDIDETPYDNESPKDYILRMIAAKADAAIAQLNLDYQCNSSQLSKPITPFIILTADTIGVLPDGKTVLVKPADRAHAYSMWRQMSDNTHQVWTAVQATLVALLPAKPTTDADKQLSNEPLKVVWQKQIIESTDVTFIPLTQDMMSDYWDSDEPADKAGGYAIQGLAAAWVTSINGSYTNVVGLPLAQTLALIDEATKSHNIYGL